MLRSTVYVVDSCVVRSNSTGISFKADLGKNCSQRPLLAHSVEIHPLAAAEFGPVTGPQRLFLYGVSRLLRRRKDLGQPLAVAAMRNSSFTPHRPRNRNRLKPRIRLRCAKSISTFSRSFIEMTYCSVLTMSQATCRASSCSSRVILWASAFGQHFAFDGQAWQTSFSVR